jgi:signal transduction histidine kinase
VESLLDLSRIMAGKLELELERLDLSKLIESAVDVVRPEAQAKQIAIDMALPSARLSLDGDAGRLQQVFWNLLSNAIKFTPGGRISVHVAQHDGEVTVRIADTGQGIPRTFSPTSSIGSSKPTASGGRLRVRPWLMWVSDDT